MHLAQQSMGEAEAWKMSRMVDNSQLKHEHSVRQRNWGEGDVGSNSRRQGSKGLLQIGAIAGGRRGMGVCRLGGTLLCNLGSSTHMP